MKKYLFIDNYRGFSNTTVPLVDVNFMVGENSSGKTSVLGLLRILSNQTMFTGGFLGGGESVQFGHFNEVVSAHATDRSYFRIGFVEERDHASKHDPKIVSGMLLTYKEHSGIPKLTRMTSSLGNREVSINIDDEIVFYKSTELKDKQSLEDVKLSLQRWNTEHGEEGDGWKELELPKGVGSAQVPLYFLLSWAINKSKDGGANFPLMLAPFDERLVWIAPIRTKPRRTYDEPSTSFSSEGTHIPYVIRRMLKSAQEAEKFKSFMDKIGRASGLFQSIDIKAFGESNDAPFEVGAVLDNEALNLSWVGYGVSQSLPILVEFLDRPKGSWFAIQQPEVHLHPRAQAALGDVFFEMAMTDSMHFVIETHSDFTIDRFRMNYRKKRSKKIAKNLPQSQILFFERNDSKNTVTPLLIGQRGELPADQPDGYREFFIKEQIHLLDF